MHDQTNINGPHARKTNRTPKGWKLVPAEPTAQIMAAAAVAAWPTASAADIELARKAARIVLMTMHAAPGTTLDMLAAHLATMAPAYRAMIGAAPPAASTQPALHDADEDTYVINQMSKLLARVAVALKGPEQALDGRGHKDLPELAAALAQELAELRARAQPAQQSEPVGMAKALSAMNNELCAFFMRWSLDGDYLRCKKCKRPHIASRIDLPFSHQSGCKAEVEGQQSPWLELVRLLAPILPAAPQAAQAAPVDADDLSLMRSAFRITELHGSPNPTEQRFHMVFKFRSLDDLHAADDQWKRWQARAALAASKQGGA